MPTEVTIPNLGYTMTVAKILRWLKAVGDGVKAGEPLLEIETDKVTYTIESPQGGTVKAILASEGDEVPVGGIVAIVGAPNEEVDVGRYQKVEQERSVSRAPKIEATSRHPSKDFQAVTDGILASPVAKKMAREDGIDLSLIKGSGRSGRIRMVDVERYVAEVRPGGVEGALLSGSGEDGKIIPMTTMRRTIARRLSQSFRDTPHFNLLAEVDMTEAKRLHELHRENTEAQTGVRLSINDTFIKTVAVILRDYPRLNARLKGDEIEVLRNINIGIAVALEDGLVVPAIERPDDKRLWQIARERKDLIERARQGRLSLEELERGTFTISNLGMYEVVSFTSILNPPQSGILSIGKTMDRPVVRSGSVVVRPIVEITLTVDHRIVDGARGACFLRDLKNALENPYLLF